MATLIKSFYNIEEYGANEGDDITAILQTGFDWLTHKTTVYIPGKYYYISNTITSPFAYGGTIYGGGDAGDSSDSFSGNNWSNARIIWNGPRDIPMFKLVGAYLTFDGSLTILGKDSNTPDNERASVGILFNKPRSGIGSGKMFFNNLTMGDCDTLIQSALVVSEHNNDNFVFNYFKTIGSCNTVYYVVALQSMKHHFMYLCNNAVCDRVFFVSGGGLIKVYSGDINGTTLLEIPANQDGIGSNNGSFVFDNIRVNSNAGTDFKALVCLRRTIALFAYNNLLIENDQYYQNDQYLFNVTGYVDVTLRDCSLIQRGMFRCRRDNIGNLGNPNVYLERCRLDSNITNASHFMHSTTNGYWLSTKDCISKTNTPITNFKTSVA